jgi:hypothetical protein
VAWAKELRKALATATVIQVSRTGPPSYVFPWALVYEPPLVDPRRLQTCKVVNELGIPGSPPGAGALPWTQRSCPYEGEPWHAQDVICPFGFWGVKHVIEQPPSIHDRSRPTTRSGPERVVSAREVRLAIGATQDPQLDLPALKAHVGRLVQLPNVRADPDPPPATDWSSVQRMLSAPTVIYFLCHGGYDAASRQAFLGVGAPASVERISAGQLSALFQTDAWREWSAPPLVFINGCETCLLEPGQMLTFVPTFAAAGAAGVIGTEVRVVQRVAQHLAETFFEALLRDGLTVGEALRKARWDLLSRGNLLGLAYTLYGVADLAVVPSAATPNE